LIPSLRFLDFITLWYSINSPALPPTASRIGISEKHVNEVSHMFLSSKSLPDLNNDVIYS
jgi:hypothetical protein